MTSINPSWPSSWSATSINGSSINDEADATSANISNDDKTTTLIAVEIDYDSTTADEGAVVYIGQDVDSTNYETPVDQPWGFMMPYAAGATRRRVFPIAADMVADFKVTVSNDSGAQITATVTYKQATLETA